MPSSHDNGVSGSSNRGMQAKHVLLKVVLLGNGGTGKSCLMNRFVSNRFDTHSFHTIGVEFLNKDIEVNGRSYTLQIWDTAGQERFKSLRTPFYRGTDICILTYALDDKVSFQGLLNWKDEFLYYADVPNKSSFPFIVIGNKVDIEPESREVAYETAMDWCAANGNLPYVETSAKEATNIQEAFTAAVERWVKLDAKIEKPYTGQTVNLSARQQMAESEHRSCCFELS